MTLEIAWLTDDLDFIPKGQLPFSRLCFGHHFCQHLLPSLDEVDAAVCMAKERGWKFTLVVPFVTDRTLESVRAILDLLEDRLPGAEVVFNDWGVLMLLQSRQLVPVAGRTFCKTKRDPRLQVLYPDLPEPLQTYYRTANVTGGRWIEFLKSYGVLRVEVDLPLWGLDFSQLRAAALPISLIFHMRM